MRMSRDTLCVCPETRHCRGARRSEEWRPAPGASDTVRPKAPIRVGSGAEATSRLDGDEGLLRTDLQLLDRPGVPVRIGETEEPAPVLVTERHDLAGLD